jgi:hypothetical protein
VDQRYAVVYGAHLKVRDCQQVEKGRVLVECDPYTFSILTEATGNIRFKDIIDKVTVHEDVDEVTGLSRLIIVDSPARPQGERHDGPADSGRDGLRVVQARDDSPG